MNELVMVQKGGYWFSYEFQCCFDDGGIGHDMYWQKTEEKIEASSDAEALKKAKEIMNPDKPCSGSFCSNKGLKRFGKLTFLDVEFVVKRREEWQVG